MRNKDREMGSGNIGVDPDRDRNGSIGPDSSTPHDRARNRDDYSGDSDPDIDEDDEDLQKKQREGNLGNERVRISER